MMRPDDLHRLGGRRRLFGQRLEATALPDPMLSARVLLVTAILGGFDSAYERRLWMRQNLPVTARQLGLFEPVEVSA